MMSKIPSTRPVARTGLPDWANFRLLGGCLLWTVFLISEEGPIFELLFYI
jgi:hypothetical protein